MLPALVSGTSAGAVVASTYAWRGRVEDVEQALAECAKMGKRLMDTNLCGIAKGLWTLATSHNFQLMGIYKGARLQRWLHHFTGGARINQTALPLAIPTVDLFSGRVTVFASRTPMRNPNPTYWHTDAGLDEAVRASTAIPVVFVPYTYRGQMLVDGGVLENLPVQSLQTLGASRVLAVVIDSTPPAHPPVIDDILEIGQYSVLATQQHLLEEQMAAAQWVLHVRVPEGTGLFDFEAMPKLEEIGYLAAKEAMPHLRTQLGTTSVTRLKGPR